MQDYEPSGENDTLARHTRLAEVLEGKRLLEWSDLETLIHDSHCLTPQGKQVAVWSIAILKELLKDRFLRIVRSLKSCLREDRNGKYT